MITLLCAVCWERGVSNDCAVLAGCLETEATLGKCLPQRTLVLLTTRHLLSEENGVTCIHKRGVARLQLESVHHQLQGIRVGRGPVGRVPVGVELATHGCA